MGARREPVSFDAQGPDDLDDPWEIANVVNVDPARYVVSETTLVLLRSSLGPVQMLADVGLEP